MDAAGINMTTNIKLMGMITPAKIPKDLIGSKGLNMFAKKATDVVLDVMAIALAELLKAYAILFLLLPWKIYG